MNPTSLDLFLRACFAGFSLILFVVSLAAARRSKGARLALVSVGFGTIAVLSWLVLLSSFMGWEDFEMSAGAVLLELVVLVFLYLSILKR